MSKSPYVHFCGFCILSQHEVFRQMESEGVFISNSQTEKPQNSLLMNVSKKFEWKTWIVFSTILLLSLLQYSGQYVIQMQLNFS